MTAAQDVRITGDVLPKRCSLPTLMIEGDERRFTLTETGDWVVQDWYGGAYQEGRDSNRDDDTGETTEWLVYPSWSKGIALTVELGRGQTAAITRIASDSLRVVISQDDEVLADTVYTGVFLVVRELTARPVAPSPAKWNEML